MRFSLRIRLTASLLAVAIPAAAASVMIGRWSVLGHVGSMTLVASLIGLFVILFGVSVAFAIAFESSAKRVFQRLQDRSEGEVSRFINLSQFTSGLHEQNAIQSAAAAETSAAVHELQETVQKNNETAKQARVSSEASRLAAENGQRSVENMTESFTHLSDTARKLVDGLKDSSSNMDELVTLIGQISEKTKAIDEIVFQTRILSFNASVEAARAGEHGRGFAVVAEEVGSLAQMSGRAAAEISSILLLGVEKAKSVSEAARNSADKLVDETKRSSESGLGRSEECKSALNGILQTVEQVNQAIDVVSRSTEEQTVGIGEIAKAIIQIESANMKTMQVVGEIDAGLKKTKIAADERMAVIHDLRGLLLGGDTLLRSPVAPSTEMPPLSTKIQRSEVVKPKVVEIPKTKSIQKPATIPKTIGSVKSLPKVEQGKFNRKKKAVGLDYPDSSDSRFEEV